MARKKRARPRSLGRKLTPKQAAFLRNFTDPRSDAFGNAARASQLAKYKGRPGSVQLAVQGFRNTHHPKLRDAIEAELEKQGFTPQFAAELLMRGMHATKVQLLRNRKGKPVPVELPDYGARMQAFDRADRICGITKDRGGTGSATGALGGMPASDPTALPQNQTKPDESKHPPLDRQLLESAAEQVRAMLSLVIREKQGACQNGEPGKQS